MITTNDKHSTTAKNVHFIYITFVMKKYIYIYYLNKVIPYLSTFGFTNMGKRTKMDMFTCIIMCICLFKNT